MAPVATAALATLWHEAALPAEALASLDLQGHDPVLPSSFAVAAAAQASLGAAALAAATIGHARGGPRQRVTVDARHAALECRSLFSVDGRVTPLWDPLSGLYRCGDGGHVRIHANFAHHRDGALRLLGLPEGPASGRDAVAQALQGWRAEDFEQAAAQARLVVAAVRDFATWDAHPQASAVAAQPLLRIERIAGVPEAQPRRWTPLLEVERPLHGLRMLELTRILAGPVAGRTLAAYGADVMLVNSPRLPNIEAIADTSRGKLSTHIDLDDEAGRAALRRLVVDAQVFLQGYRPGGLAARGFAPHDLARLRPGIVCVSLSAYGPDGPWSDRRGFDSLVQSATGFNRAEAAAFGQDEPRALPMQILDYASGYLMAFGALAALWRQALEGGSWHVQVSLARTGLWLRSMPRVPGGPQAVAPDPDEWFADYPGGFGLVRALRHAARFSATPAHWARPAMPPGSHPPVWP